MIAVRLFVTDLILCEFSEQEVSTSKMTRYLTSARPLFDMKFVHDPVHDRAKYNTDNANDHVTAVECVTGSDEFGPSAFESRHTDQ